MSEVNRMHPLKLSDSSQHTITYVLLFIAVVASLVALGLAIKNSNDLTQEQQQIDALKPKAKENFSNAQIKAKDSANGYVSDNSDPARLRKMRGSDDWWSDNSNGNTKVFDGMDAANQINGGAAQSQCGPIATAEPAHPHLSSYSGAPSMYNAALANSTAYPDETAAQSLAGKTTYSCAPDITNVGGCDYAINPDNLMPGSWREGVSCSDGTDPNSQWAKYHPTRDKYYRYITAAGSARLGANTRSSSRKILGLQNPLRSGTSTPLSSTMVTPFMESSLRAQAIFDATGMHPTSFHC